MSCLGVFAVRLFFMVAVRGRPSGLPGVLTDLVLHTCVQLPLSFVCKREGVGSLSLLGVSDMFKVTPNPPVSLCLETIDPHIVDRALAHYNLPPGAGSKRCGAHSTRKINAEPESREEILVDASSILESASATAYEHADNLTGPGHNIALG